MATLLKCIDTLIDNISVTDRQEANIDRSLSNIKSHLLNKDNHLSINRAFTSGSYERDTIIKPLNDIDIFAVLNFEEWKNEYGTLPTPQSVLTKIKNYLNDQNDYQDKVTQDRPCVTVELSDKKFEILPSFEQIGGGYKIPTYNLSDWTFSFPEQLTKDLNDTHKNCNYKLKQIIKVIKYWNRENEKIIPSYHIEEAAINIFKLNNFKNFEEAIRLWFNNAERNLYSYKFKSNEEYQKILDKIIKVKDKLNNANTKYNSSQEGEAIQIWKNIFGAKFPTVDIEEAKSLSEALSDGKLKITKEGTISTAIGVSVAASKGFFGDGI